MSIAQAILREFEGQVPVTRKFLERLPENQLTWKPHEKSMSAGQLAYHLAFVPGGVIQFVQNSPAPARQKIGEKGRNVSALSFHSLRHSFTSAMANANVPAEIRQKLTGHADSKSHATYTHHELAPTTCGGGHHSFPWTSRLI